MNEPFSRLPRRVLQDDQLPAQARLLYAALDGFTDKRTGHCAPTIARLAGQLGCSKRWVIDLIEMLQGAGWLEVEKRSGFPNRYLLQHEVNNEKSDKTTREAEFTGTREAEFTGGAVLPNSAHQEQEEEGATPSPESAPLRPAPSLFAAKQRRDRRAAVDYFLAERPELVHLRGWFPGLVAEFFLAQCWDRPDDDDRALLWAKRLAHASQAEVAAAFRWAVENPNDAQGRKVFNRTDQLNRIVGYIDAQRRLAARSQAAAKRPAGQPSAEELEKGRELLQAWRSKEAPK